MSEKKSLKQAVKTIWKGVKQLRADSDDRFHPAEIKASADALTGYADELRRLATEISALSSMPTEAAPPVAKRKRKASPPS
ncbi:MAG: hypothetical protein H7124_05405 [Phycisphaerales bacterium]|nr:hypothetical protein [Hyphomonadaceae bacterium]